MSPYVHAAKGSQIPPHRAQQAAPARCSSSAQRGPTLTVFSTDQFLDVLQEIKSKTGIWGRLSNEACGRSNEVNSEVNSEVILRSKQVLNSVKQVLMSVEQVLNSVKQS